MKKKKKSNKGRPWFDGRKEEEVIRKLEEAFAIGCTNREACIYADITEAMYYNYMKGKQDLAKRFDLLKDKPILKARNTFVKALDQPEYAVKYLERKLRNEFAISSRTLVGEDKEAPFTTLTDMLKGLKNSEREKME